MQDHQSTLVAITSVVAYDEVCLERIVEYMTLHKKNLESFRPGIYLHYKGTLYEADHLVRDANDESRIGVHYIGLELDGAKNGPRHLIRSWEDWTALIHGDGTVCHHHKRGICLDSNLPVIERFHYLGSFYEAWMRDERIREE